MHLPYGELWLPKSCGHREHRPRAQSSSSLGPRHFCCEFTERLLHGGRGVGPTHRSLAWGLRRPPAYPRSPNPRSGPTAVLHGALH